MNDYRMAGMNDINDYLAAGWQVETKELLDGKTKFLLSRHKMIGFVEGMLKRVESQLDQIVMSDIHNRDKDETITALCIYCHAEKFNAVQEVRHIMECPIRLLRDIESDMIGHLGKFKHEQRRIF